MTQSDRTPDEPVFCEPWEAHVFALVVALQDTGVFTAGEWAEALGAAIRRKPELDDLITTSSTYKPWIVALEGLLVARGATSGGMLGILRALWDDAARAAPHGTPIEIAAPPYPAAM